MAGMLADLNQSVPVMGCEFLAAVSALSILLHILNNFCDLDFHGVRHFPIKNDSELHAFGVGFRPNKRSRLEGDLIESLGLLEEDAHHVLALAIAVDPGRPLESLAVSAVIDGLAGEELLVGHGLDGAGGADAAGLRDELDAAEGTQDGGFGADHQYYMAGCQNTFIMRK